MKYNSFDTALVVMIMLEWTDLHDYPWWGYLLVILASVVVSIPSMAK